MLPVSYFRMLFLIAAFYLGIGLAAAAPMAYFGNFRENTVSVIKAAANSVVGTMPRSAGHR